MPKMFAVNLKDTFINVVKLLYAKYFLTYEHTYILVFCFNHIILE